MIRNPSLSETKTYRPSRLQKMRCLVCASAILLSPLGKADDVVMWPSSGVFPAYPIADQQSRWNFFAVGEARHDDNLFKLSDGADPTVVLGVPERDDTYVRLGAQLKGDLELSRQHLLVDAEANHYSFNRFDQLDNWLYHGAIDWQWVAGDSWHGDLGYSRSRAFPNFADLQFASSDLLTYQRGYAAIDLRIHANWELRTLFEQTQVDHSAVIQEQLDNRISSGTIGLHYGSLSQAILGVQFKASEGDYPNRQEINTLFVDNRYREYQEGLVLEKQVTGKSNINLEVDYTRRNHNSLSERDFAGVTGRFAIRYSPSNKVIFNAALYRELQAVEDLSASYAEVSGVSFGPSWAPTSKIVLEAAIKFEKRTFDGDPGFVINDLPPREDRTRSWRVAFGYQPIERVKFSLAYERQKRTADQETEEYNDNVASLQLKVRL